jgi:hypothetical protein
MNNFIFFLILYFLLNYILCGHLGCRNHGIVIDSDLLFLSRLALRLVALVVCSRFRLYVSYSFTSKNGQSLVGLVI